LDTLQLVHGAIKLPVQVSFVAEKFVGCIRRRQAEAPGFRVSIQFLALQRVSLEHVNPFQPIVDKCDEIAASFASLFGFNAVR